MAETCWPYSKPEMKILRDYYNVPNHIPDEQVERYIEVSINTKRPRKMKIGVTEDALALGIPYIKY